MSASNEENVAPQGVTRKSALMRAEAVKYEIASKVYEALEALDGPAWLSPLSHDVPWAGLPQPEAPPLWVWWCTNAMPDGVPHDLRPNAARDARAVARCRLGRGPPCGVVRPSGRRRVTHAELVARAAAWLRNTRKCGVVLTEAAGGHEIPDAIGFRIGGRASVLVECKASRSDFLRDSRKWTRRHEATVGVGQERVYMAPVGMIRPDEVPEGWGLVEVTHSGRALVTVKPPVRANDPERVAREIGFLYSAAYKAQHRDPQAAPRGPQETP